MFNISSLKTNIRDSADLCFAIHIWERHFEDFDYSLQDISIVYIFMYIYNDIIWMWSVSEMEYQFHRFGSSNDNPLNEEIKITTESGTTCELI